MFNPFLIDYMYMIAHIYKNVKPYTRLHYNAAILDLNAAKSALAATSVFNDAILI